ncbi:MAG: universal stress protein [Bdellovibrionota bacterium]
MIAKRILVPTDFSRYAQEAFSKAKEIAAESGAAIHLLHVVEPVAVPMTVAMGLPSGDVLDRMETSAQEALRAFVKKNAGAGAVESLVTVGSPASEIVRYADRNKIDLIVMPTRGNTGLTHFLLGSVAERVVRTAKCPVLIVPPQGKGGKKKKKR